MSEVNGGELIHEVIRLEDPEDEKAKERIKDEDSANISQRETIRRQLADNSDEDKEELTNHNLLLCFLNENPESDLEDYETSSPALSRSATKIPNNHPLACLKENNRTVDDWESDSDSDISDTSDSLVRPDSNCISTPQQRKNREFDGNISRKQGHVIIPLRCSEVLNLGNQDHSGSSPRRSPLADSFFQQLSSIQTETRRQLLEAKSVAEKEVEEQRSKRRVRDDISQLLYPSSSTNKVENNFGQLCKSAGVGTSTAGGNCKLNRRILTPMNVSQLQVILNYLLTQIETLNENLVQYLMTRDELAIEQDSLLTDIEDITKCIQGHDMSPF